MPWLLLLVCHGMSRYLAQMSRDIGMALYISTFAFVLCVVWNLSKDLFIQISNYNASNRCLFLVSYTCARLLMDFRFAHFRTSAPMMLFSSNTYAIHWLIDFTLRSLWLMNGAVVEAFQCNLERKLSCETDHITVWTSN